jgi:hypothetical protein
MKLRDAWIARSTRGEMKVGELGKDRIPAFRGRPYLDGGLFEPVAQATGETAKRIVLAAFQRAVLDMVSPIPPEVADRELQKIDEYREASRLGS